MCKWYKLDTLKGVDQLFIKTTSSNIIYVFSTEKYKFEEMRDFVVKGITGTPRFNSKLVQFFGTYYFMQMNDSEWKQK